MKLAILKGSHKEDNVIIYRVPYAIGRCRSADFIITHVNVSRNHCKIVKESGLWKIYDFSSSGTYVNDILVGEGKSLCLNNGDSIRFGPFESNLCRTFYSFGTSSENFHDSGVTSSVPTFPDFNEKYRPKEKHGSSKADNVGMTCKQTQVLEEIEETPEYFDLKFRKGNKKPLGVQKERATNVVSQNINERNSKVRGTNTKEIEELTKELQQVRKALSNLEGKKCAVQKELIVETNSKTVPSSDKNLLENLADLMEAEFQCTICSELFVTAVTLGCSHTFCKYCIDQWKKKQKTCPVCRKKITNETQSLVVDNYIDKMVGNLSLQLKERREAIIKERNKSGLSKKRSKLKK